MQIGYENTLENNEREFEQFQADQLKLCKQHTIKDIKNLLLSLDNNDKYWNYFSITHKIKLLKAEFPDVDEAAKQIYFLMYEKRTIFDNRERYNDIDNEPENYFVELMRQYHEGKIDKEEAIELTWQLSIKGYITVEERDRALSLIIKNRDIIPVEIEYDDTLSDSNEPHIYSIMITLYPIKYPQIETEAEYDIFIIDETNSTVDYSYNTYIPNNYDESILQTLFNYTVKYNIDSDNIGIDMNSEVAEDIINDFISKYIEPLDDGWTPEE